MEGASPTIDAGDHQLKFGAEFNKADIFNLFVQNATGTLVFRNIADLQNGILSPGDRAASARPRPRRRRSTSCTGCTVGAFGNFSATGDVNDAAAAFKRTIYSAVPAGRLAGHRPAERGRSAFASTWFDGGAPRKNPNFVNRYGFDNSTGFATSTRSCCRASA